MKQQTSILAFLVLALLAGAARAESPKILVVFLKRVIDESEEGKAFVGKLRKQIEDKKQEVATQVQDLQERQKRLQETEAGDRDAKWYEEFEKLMNEISLLKAQEQIFVTQLNDKIGRALNELIRGAQQEARAIMKKRGAEMVLVSRMGPVKIQSDQELQTEIISRRVLCASGDVDITDEVLKRMDEYYRKNKTSKGVVPTRNENSRKAAVNDGD